MTEFSTLFVLPSWPLDTITECMIKPVSAPYSCTYIDAKLLPHNHSHGGTAGMASLPNNRGPLVGWLILHRRQSKLSGLPLLARKS